MESRRRFLHPDMERRSDGDGGSDPLNGLRAKRSRRYPGKSGYRIQTVKGKRKLRRVAKHCGRLPGKASSNACPARTKTDTGGWAEYAKVSERTVAKELGKMAPYVRKKGRSKEPQ